MVIKERHGCLIAYADGPEDTPLHALIRITRRTPDRIVMDLHIARLLGALLVGGRKADLQRLRKAAEVEALARAKEGYRNHLHRLSEAALNWLAIGEQDAASQALFAITVGVAPIGYAADKSVHAPETARHFARCGSLYEAVPEVRAQFERARKLGRTWSAVVDRWDEIMPLHRAGKRKALDALLDLCVNPPGPPRKKRDAAIVVAASVAPNPVDARQDAVAYLFKKPGCKDVISANPRAKDMQSGWTRVALAEVVSRRPPNRSSRRHQSGVEGAHEA